MKYRVGELPGDICGDNRLSPVVLGGFRIMGYALFMFGIVHPSRAKRSASCRPQ